MKVEQAKQIASNAIEQLRQALEAGHSEGLKEYLAAMARFRRYSWHNVTRFLRRDSLSIRSRKPSSPLPPVNQRDGVIITMYRGLSFIALSTNF